MNNQQLERLQIQSPHSIQSESFTDYFKHSFHEASKENISKCILLQGYKYEGTDLQHLLQVHNVEIMFCLHNTRWQVQNPQTIFALTAR